jgi:hypothetical protein
VTRWAIRRVAIVSFAIGVAASMPAVAASAGAESRAALVARWAAASHRSPQLLESKGPVATPPAALQRLAAAELAVPGRYRIVAPHAVPAQRSPWLYAWDWIRDRWNDLWRAAFGHAESVRNGAYVVGDILIAAVAVLLIVVALRLLATLVIDRRSAARAARLDDEPDASALYAAACALARSGDYGRASVALFAAAIAVLSTRDLIRDDRSATVGELRRTLQTDRTALLAPFDDVAASFVLGAYAERPVSWQDWERARASYLRIAREASA